MKKQREGNKKPEKKGEEEKKKSLFRVWIIETFIPAAAVALFVITFIAQIYKIPSGSMIPTLKVGDRILVVKFTYGIRVPFTGKWLFQHRRPKRGDVMVFLFDKDPWEKKTFINRVTGFLFRKEPWSNRMNFIKRVIGTPGDRVEIKDGNVYINGQLIDEPPAIPKDRFYYNVKEGSREVFYTKGEIVIPKNNYFVLGDNSANSRDSRYWGLVPIEKVKGKAVFIIWPPRRIGVIH
ncbi:MAG: signal peptidase I [Nitrospirae bacterium]|nr:signal peptidase I [Nitrospirota bacterium]